MLRRPHVSEWKGNVAIHQLPRPCLVLVAAMAICTLGTTTAQAQRSQSRSTSMLATENEDFPSLANEPLPAAEPSEMSLVYVPPELSAEYDLSRLVRRAVSVSCFLAAACLACFLWSHLRRGRSVRAAPQQRIQVLDSIAVAPRCFLHLVQVENQPFIVARDSSGFHGITPVSKPYASEHPFASSLYQAEAELRPQHGANLAPRDRLTSDSFADNERRETTPQQLETDGWPASSTPQPTLFRRERQQSSKTFRTLNG